VHATARSSLLLFAAAFAASSLHRLLRARATAWLVRNRRWLGLSMALSHAVHLGAIATLATRWPAGAAIPTPTRIAGSLGTLALAALVATSSDRAVLRLGRPRWHALHRACVWTVWGVFTASYALGALASPGAAAALAFLIALAGLRLAAARGSLSLTTTRTPAGREGATDRSVR
jgi:hypothetical protein